MSRVCLHIDRKEIRVPQSSVEYYLGQGYVLGKPKRTEEHCKALSRALTGSRNTEVTRERKRQAKLGKAWRVIGNKRVWMDKDLAREIDLNLD